MTTFRRRLFVAATASAAVVALTLAGCAPTPAPKPSEQPPAQQSPTPVQEEPRAAFDGNCDAVLTAQALSDAVGEQMNVWAPTWADGADRALGGVACGWSSAQYLSAYVAVQVFPLEVLDSEFVSSSEANSCTTETAECRASEIFGDVWVGVRVSSDSAATVIEEMRPLLADIGARATAQPRPVPEKREDWWAPAPTCDEMADGLADGGSGFATAEVQNASPQIFDGGPLLRTCTVTTSFGDVSYSTLVHLRAGGAEAVESALALNSEARMDHNGRVFAAAAEQYPIDGAAGVLLGAIGPNLVELDRRDYDMPSPHDALVLDAVITALG